MKFKKWWWLLILVVPVGLGALSIQSCRTPDLGLVDGRLMPCPEKDNCVCSQDDRDKYAIDPLAVVVGESTDDTLENTRQLLMDTAAALPRCALLQDDGAYLRFVATSAFWRFKDDLEFLISPAEGQVHMRSASRTGSSDFGVNRERVDEFRRIYDEKRNAGAPASEEKRPK